MTEGTVVYLTNASTLSEELEDERICSALQLSPAATVVAADRPGYYDLNQATHRLLARGAKRGKAIRVRVAADGDLEVLGEPLHLFG